MSDESKEFDAALVKLDEIVSRIADEPRMTEDQYVDYIADRVIARLKEREAGDA